MLRVWVLIVWDAVADAVRYEIREGSNAELKVAVNYFTFRDLAASTDYSFEVCSVGGDGMSEWSSVVAAAITSYVENVHVRIAFLGEVLLLGLYPADKSWLWRCNSTVAKRPMRRFHRPRAGF